MRCLPALLATMLLLSLGQLAFAGNEMLAKFPEGASVLCVEEKASGFNWKVDQWEHTRFRAEDKYLVKKLPLEKYKDASERRKNKYYLCKDPEVTDYTEKGKGFSGFVEACYEVKEFGKEGTSLDSTMCYEDWQDGKLRSINCDRKKPAFFFAPDGQFIRHPWQSDVANKKTKDSLVVSVGSCSRL